MGKHGMYATQKYLGMKKGHLTVTGYEAGRFICRCDCGNEKKVIPIKFLNNMVKSCGYDCPLRSHVDGQEHSRPLYFIWKRMEYKSRNSKGTIKICQEWVNDFHTFYKWAINSGYHPGLYLKRINVWKDYTPDNCKWAEHSATVIPYPSTP